MIEERSEPITGYTWPSAKKAVRMAAAQDGCTPSEWLHVLAVDELRKRGLLPKDSNGSSQSTK